MADITKIQLMGDSTQYDLLARGLKHADQVKSSTDLDNFLESNVFKIATFDTKSEETNTTGLASNDGLLLSMGWTGSTTYGFQLIIDDAANNLIKLRAKNSTWANWSTLLHEHNYTTWTVKKDGTGATGTWGISISGNAATATKLSNTPSSNTYFLRGDNTWTNYLKNCFVADNGTSTSIAAYVWNKSGTYWGGLGWKNGTCLKIGACLQNGTWQDSANYSLSVQGPLFVESTGNESYINFYQNGVVKNQLDAGASEFIIFSNNTFSNGTTTWARNMDIDRATGITKFYKTVKIIDNASNSDVDGLFYIENKSNADWGEIINCGDYNYGLDVRCGSTQVYAIRATGRITGTTVYGAVWNDYAEFRKTCDAKPGQCVLEIEQGNLKISNQRCAPAARVVSDTFGFAIGETEECKTPIAVSGRVLVYTDGSSLKIGDAVCSGKNGTVSKMRWYERILHPERMVGVVSEFPDYDEWLAGERDGNHCIKVDGRIWIYVK